MLDHLATTAGPGRRAGDRAGAAPSIRSDVDPLVTVLLHRPGAELRAVDPARPGAALFDGPADLLGTRREHDALTAALRERGVTVLHLERLLADVLAEPARRRELVERALPGHGADVRAAVVALPPARGARALIGGLDLDGRALLEPLPNLLYTRDCSAWVGGGALVGSMAAPVRRREGPLLEALYRTHPVFAGAAVHPGPVAPFEGGDVLVAGSGRVLLGLSERTSADGARAVAGTLLAAGEVEEVVTVGVPEGAGFHLDLVLTLVDHDTFAVWKPVRAALRGHRWRRSGATVTATPVDDPLAGARVIAVDGDDAEAHGRPWDHGTNLLAIAPGVVVAYADNVRARERLEAAGITVVPVPGAALGAGRGGPRCLSCPVRRDPSLVVDHAG
jgi:arginine deiminase